MLRKARNMVLVSVALFALYVSAGDVVKVSKVKHTTQIGMPASMVYQITEGKLNIPQTLRRTAANGIMADFSVQSATSNVDVWSENFDSDDRDAKGNLLLSGWTLDQGEGNAVTFTKEKKDFNTIDENDVYSLHIDGPYQVYKRTKASATSSAISVPANGQLHAYVRMAPMWNEYVTVAIQVSADDFETQTEVWNSKEVTEGSARWIAVDADLSAFVGKQIKIRLFWGPGTDDSFNTGGYMGDFYVDGLSVTGVQSLSSNFFLP